jgi:hypothetical protein
MPQFATRDALKWLDVFIDPDGSVFVLVARVLLKQARHGFIPAIHRGVAHAHG